MMWGELEQHQSEVLKSPSNNFIFKLVSLTASQIHKGVLFHHLHLVDDLGHQVKGGLSVHLGREGLVVVEFLRVGDGVVVDLLQDVTQQAVGRPLVEFHGLGGSFPL